MSSSYYPSYDIDIWALRIFHLINIVGYRMRQKLISNFSGKSFRHWRDNIINDKYSSECHLCPSNFQLEQCGAICFTTSQRVHDVTLLFKQFLPRPHFICLSLNFILNGVKIDVIFNHVVYIIVFEWCINGVDIVTIHHCMDPKISAHIFATQIFEREIA